ncbi:MAG TPA: hypothetical protein PKN33_07900 [Phycisphaerae bacterium]|nr:hypothetical protein [Phycisphaerae bacterium]
MADHDLIRFHLDGLVEYLDCWASSEVRAETGISREESAFYILEHAAMLQRMTGDHRAITGVESEVGDLESLVASACKHVQGFTHAAWLRALPDALDTDEIEQAEAILLQRDELEAALDLGTEFVRSELEHNDSHLLDALACARCVAAEIDDELQRRTDVTEAVAGILSIRLADLAINPDTDQYWWFRLLQDRESGGTEVQESKRNIQSFAPPLRVAADAPIAGALDAAHLKEYLTTEKLREIVERSTTAPFIYVWFLVDSSGRIIVHAVHQRQASDFLENASPGHRAVKSKLYRIKDPDSLSEEDKRRIRCWLNELTDDSVSTAEIIEQI